MGVETAESRGRRLELSLQLAVQVKSNDVPSMGSEAGGRRRRRRRRRGSGRKRRRKSCNPSVNTKSRAWCTLCGDTAKAPEKHLSHELSSILLS